MRVEVRPMSLQGKVLNKPEREALAPARGRLKLFENRIHALGRSVRVAQVLSITADAETALLPELLDAEVLFLDDDILRVRGIEMINGVAFGQTWHVTVL